MSQSTTKTTTVVVALDGAAFLTSLRDMQHTDVELAPSRVRSCPREPPRGHHGP